MHADLPCDDRAIGSVGEGPMHHAFLRKRFGLSSKPLRPLGDEDRPVRLCKKEDAVDTTCICAQYLAGELRLNRELYGASRYCRTNAL